MRSKKAFTLIELLVVIAIIALLLGILIPALSKARMQARRAFCGSLLRSYGAANHTYASSNYDRYVPFSQYTADPDHIGAFGYWDERWPENREFRRCISTNRKKVEDSGWNDPFEFPKELRCPAHKVGDEDEYVFEFESAKGWRVIMSYALNTERWVSSSSIYDEGHWYPSDGKYRGHYVTKIRRPTESIMFIDSNYYQTRYDRADYKIYWDVYHDTLKPVNFAQVAYRHGESANMVFFDGHVHNLPKEKVYNHENPVRPYAPNRRDPSILWDVEYPTVGSKR